LGEFNNLTLLFLSSEKETVYIQDTTTGFARRNWRKPREIRVRIAGNPTSVTIMYEYLCSTVRRITGTTIYPLNFTMFQF